MSLASFLPDDVVQNCSHPFQGTANWAIFASTKTHPSNLVDWRDRIIIGTPFFNLPVLNLKHSHANLLSDTSLSLSEFAPELSGLPSDLTQPSRKLWGNWDGICAMFKNFLCSRPEFKAVIRTGRLYNRNKFHWAKARERFPSTVGRDRLQFETCLVVDR